MAGTLYTGADGVQRQASEPGSQGMYTSGGRKKRFIRYLQQLRAYLDTAIISIEDREILDAAAEGTPVRKIAKDLGLYRKRVHETIHRHRIRAGIRGPGSGR